MKTINLFFSFILILSFVFSQFNLFVNPYYPIFIAKDINVFDSLNDSNPKIHIYDVYFNVKAMSDGIIYYADLPNFPRTKNYYMSFPVRGKYVSQLSAGRNALTFFVAYAYRFNSNDYFVFSVIDKDTFDEYKYIIHLKIIGADTDLIVNGLTNKTFIASNLENIWFLNIKSDFPVSMVYEENGSSCAVCSLNNNKLYCKLKDLFYTDYCDLNLLFFDSVKHSVELPLRLSYIADISLNNIINIPELEKSPEFESGIVNIHLELRNNYNFDFENLNARILFSIDPNDCNSPVLMPDSLTLNKLTIKQGQTYSDVISMYIPKQNKDKCNYYLSIYLDDGNELHSVKMYAFSSHN